MAIVERPKGQVQAPKVDDFIDDIDSLAPIPDNEIGNVTMADVPLEVAEMAPEDRPKVKVVREDGKVQRRTRAVSLGLSEKILPPFTKGKIAKYRAVYREGIDPATKQAPDFTDILLPGTYSFHDIFEADPLRRYKLMKNLGREEVVYNDVTQKEERRHNILPVELVNGMLDVNIETHYRLYVFMELHPLNRSNRWRDTNNAVVFERIDLQHDRTTAYLSAEADLAMDAEMAVKDELQDADRIIGYGVQMGVDVIGRAPSDIKHDLRLKARNDPKKFFSLSNNIAPSVRLNIHDGLGKGIIFFNGDRHQFEFTESEEVMHVAPIGVDPVEDFTKAVVSKKPEARAAYDKMMDLLNYWA